MAQPIAEVSDSSEWNQEKDDPDVVDYVADVWGSMLHRHASRATQVFEKRYPRKRFFMFSDARRPDLWPSKKQFLLFGVPSHLSNQLEQAIVTSSAILTLEPSPDDSPGAMYQAATLARAHTLLREMASLFWQATGDLLPVPAINGAGEGAIDVFWNLPESSLLVNFPADESKGATFFGRRFASSKISGVLGADDNQPKHLTGWLAGRD
jgi:hypothetical protein